MQPFYDLTRNLSANKLLGGALVVLALALFIPFSTNLIQQRVSTTPQAGNQNQAPETSISLVRHQFNCAKGDPPNGVPAQANCNQINTGRVFAVNVLIRSDIDTANLFNVSLKYPKDLLSVERIAVKGNGTDDKSTDFFISSWVNRYYNNDDGEVQLVGAVPTPGFKTEQGKPAIMARIYFKQKKAGNAQIAVSPDSAIYRNADNANILKTTRNLDISSN